MFCNLSRKTFLRRKTWFTTTFLVSVLIGCISLAEEEPEDRLQPYMRAYFISARPNLDWQSPKSLARSAVRNYVLAVANPSLHPIGHSIVEIDCPNVFEKRELFAVTGGSNRGDLDRFFFDGLGADILLKDISGQLQRNDELDPILVRQSRSGSIRSIKVLLSKDACVRISEYLDEIIKQRVYNNFRADHNPLLGHGSGCASFALSFLELIGVEFGGHNFTRNLRIPKSLFPTADRKITPLHLMIADGSQSWADESEDHVHLVLPDPSVVSEWIQGILEERPQVLEGLSISYMDLEFEVDARRVQVPPKARFPIFSQ